MGAKKRGSDRRKFQFIDANELTALKELVALKRKRKRKGKGKVIGVIRRTRLVKIDEVKSKNETRAEFTEISEEGNTSESEHSSMQYSKVQNENKSSKVNITKDEECENENNLGQDPIPDTDQRLQEGTQSKDEDSVQTKRKKIQTKRKTKKKPARRRKRTKAEEIPEECKRAEWEEISDGNEENLRSEDDHSSKDEKKSKKVKLSEDEESENESNLRQEPLPDEDRKSPSVNEESFEEYKNSEFAKGLKPNRKTKKKLSRRRQHTKPEETPEEGKSAEWEEISDENEENQEEPLPDEDRKSRYVIEESSEEHKNSEIENRSKAKTQKKNSLRRQHTKSEEIPEESKSGEWEEISDENEDNPESGETEYDRSSKDENKSKKVKISEDEESDNENNLRQEPLPGEDRKSRYVLEESSEETTNSEFENRSKPKRKMKKKPSRRRQHTDAEEMPEEDKSTEWKEISDENEENQETEDDHSSKDEHNSEKVKISEDEESDNENSLRQEPLQDEDLKSRYVITESSEETTNSEFENRSKPKRKTQRKPSRRRQHSEPEEMPEEGKRAEWEEISDENEKNQENEDEHSSKDEKKSKKVKISEDEESDNENNLRQEPIPDEDRKSRYVIEESSEETTNSEFENRSKSKRKTQRKPSRRRQHTEPEEMPEEGKRAEWEEISDENEENQETEDEHSSKDEKKSKKVKISEDEESDNENNLRQEPPPDEDLKSRYVIEESSEETTNSEFENWSKPKRKTQRKPSPRRQHTEPEEMPEQGKRAEWEEISDENDENQETEDEHSSKDEKKSKKVKISEDEESDTENNLRQEPPPDEDRKSRYVIEESSEETTNSEFENRSKPKRKTQRKPSRRRQHTEPERMPEEGKRAEWEEISDENEDNQETEDEHRSKDEKKSKKVKISEDEESDNENNLRQEPPPDEYRKSRYVIEESSEETTNSEFENRSKPKRKTQRKPSRRRQHTEPEEMPEEGKRAKWEENSDENQENQETEYDNISKDTNSDSGNSSGQGKPDYRESPEQQSYFERDRSARHDTKADDGTSTEQSTQQEDENDSQQVNASDDSENDSDDAHKYQARKRSSSKSSPKFFDIILSSQEYEEIRPSVHKKDKFKRGWTNVIAKKFKAVNSRCVLKFLYHKVQFIKETTKGTPNYFFSRAVCKHENCGEWLFQIANEPKRTRPVVMTVTTTKPDRKHKPGVVKQRQLSGKLRKEAQNELKTEGPSSMYYTKYGEMKAEEIRAGNYTACQSESVLRKAKNESNVGAILHPDPFTELALIKEVFDSDEPYIQELCYKPFMTVLYSEESLKVTKNCIKRGSGVLYIDATGSVIKKIDKKRVLYYCMVVREKNSIIVPVIEFITDHHATHYLVRPLLSFASALGKNIQPVRIEVDFSWAIIHGVLLSFNYMTIHAYLRLCFEICTGKVSQSNLTVIHVCCAHVLKALRDKVKEKVKDKKLREVVLRMMAILQNSTSLEEAVEIWKVLCTVLKHKLKSEEVTRALVRLNRMLEEASTESLLEEDENFTCNEDLGDNGLIGEDRKKKLGIREQSPFRPIFFQYMVIDESIETNDHEEDNPYFNNEILNFIGNNYMPLYPLWSGCMLEVVDGEKRTRDSNTAVENWMKVVKANILMGAKNLRVGHFVRKLRPVVRGRLRKVQFSKFAEQTKKKRKRKLSPTEDIHDAEERWNKKGKGKQKTSFFYSPPESIPIPKTRKIPKQGKGTYKKATSARKRKNNGAVNPPGLRNARNSCWLNSTLQAIASMKRLNCKGGGRISSEAQKMIQRLRIHGIYSYVIDPKEAREAAELGIRNFRRGQQQDGAEYVTRLMHSTNQFIEMKHVMSCLVCQKETRTIEKTCVLTVSVAQLTNASLKDCVDEFSKEEMLTEDNTPRCFVCQRRTIHSRRTVLNVTDDVLLIHLKRFQMSRSGMHRKDNRNIRINWVLGLKDVGVYRLYAVQCHLGTSMETGHYVTVTVDDEWVVRRCDDSYIEILGNEAMNDKEVRTSAYVLYYGQMSMNDARTLLNKCPDITLTTCGEIDLTGRDISSVLPDTRLNDQVINAYMSLITANYPHTSSLDVFFSSCLMSGRSINPDTFLKEDLLGKEKVLVPFIYRHHWTLLVLYPETHFIRVYDSMVGGSNEPAETLRRYMTERDGVTYRVRTMKVLPRQNNDVDCGVFVCKFARCVAAGEEIDFDQGNIQRYRKQMVFECLASSLL